MHQNAFQKTNRSTAMELLALGVAGAQEKGQPVF